jgi:N utilization substance protein A
VKTVEDLAGCATDDLVGWTERKDGQAVKQPGFLDGFELSRTDAENIVMAARLAAGWIEALPEPQAEEESPDEVQDGTGDGA